MDLLEEKCFHKERHTITNLKNKNIKLEVGEIVFAIDGLTWV